jgi:hypothetical protein
LHAFMDRDKIRDLYDLTFIVNNHWNNLGEDNQLEIITGLKIKDLANQYDVVAQQDDELIDKTELEHNVLITLDKLGLIQANK